MTSLVAFSNNDVIETIINTIFRANELCSRIDNEIAIVHKFVQDMYQDRFPELAGMVPEPIVYLKTVNILMNDIEKGRFSVKNDPILEALFRSEKAGSSSIFTNNSNRFGDG